MNGARQDPSMTPTLRRAVVLAIAMFAAAISVGSVERIPGAAIVAPNLDEMLPDDFGEWRRAPLSAAVLPVEAEIGPGEAVAYRAYRDSAGRSVTLVIAYGPPLGDSVRLHRPESCYVAQGFAIQTRSIKNLSLANGMMKVIRLEAENSIRNEAITYWLRDGDDYVDSAYGHELLDFKRGFERRADGALVRVSSKGKGASAFPLHERFLSDFTQALNAEAAQLLLVDDGAARAGS